MTTIVYDAKAGVIAYDTRQTLDGVVMTDDAEKCSDCDALFFLAGDSSHETAFVNAWLMGEPLEGECDIDALVVDDGNVRLAGVSAGKIWSVPLTHSWAIGSGAAYALGAMDAGVGAVQAVRIAMHRDPMTGGEVRVHILGADHVD